MRSAAFWATRLSTLSHVGQFDEKIFYAPEDADVCMAMLLAGYRVMFVPDYRAIHHTNELSRKLIPNRFTYLHIKGLIYFFSKYRYVFSTRDIHARGKSMFEKRWVSAADGAE